MDPELWELYEAGSPDDEVSVIIRLAPGAEPPPSVRIVCTFGDIYTARMSRGDIIAARQNPSVISLKASGLITPPLPIMDATEDETEVEAPGGSSMPEAASLSPLGEDGRGVVVGICDWGFDFTHANFRNPDGTTRLEALWDQRGFGDALAPAPYNQGRLLTRAAINAALAEADPCAALGYHPASGDPTDSGAHGTHVADILAGNRREPGSEVGLASASDLVFVHLGAYKQGELGSLGDSVGLLEGLDFVRRQAAGRPCVVNLSAGKTLGPKRATSLLERAVDQMLEQPGLVLVQSVGNYADAAMHTHARVGPDQQYVFDWLIPEGDRTPNELEVWYSGQDVFEVTLVSPDGRDFSVALGERLPLRAGPTLWGNFYHRFREPNSGLNHVVLFLYTAAPSGRWRVRLHGREVVDGRLHAWIERDAGARYQSRFPRSQATSRFTTNTICNCFRAIAVGAFDGTQPRRPPTRFSSRGPTADGRQKPEIAAPGYRIKAARSMPRDGWRSQPHLVVKSGTSMAAPRVSGTVALMLAAAGRPLTIHEVRRALIGTADPHPGPAGRSSTQLGYGYLNTAAAIEAARRLGREPARPYSPAALPVDDREWVETARETEETGWAPVSVENAAGGEVGEVPPEDGDLRTDETAGEAAEESGWAPVSLEDAASAGIDAAASEDSDPSAGGVEAPIEECGCSHRPASSAAEGADEQADDEAGSIAPFDAAEETIVTPFAWEDVRDALEAARVDAG
jgi:subtilisin family serine protease